MPFRARGPRATTWKYGIFVPSFDVASCWLTIEPFGVEERRRLLQLLGRPLAERAERERDGREVVVDRQEVVVRLVGIDGRGAGDCRTSGSAGSSSRCQSPSLRRQHVEPVADVVELVEDDVVPGRRRRRRATSRSVGSNSTSNLRSPFRKPSKSAASSAPAG